MWELFKTFIEGRQQNTWLHNHLEYFIIVGILATVILAVIYIVKLRKDSQRMKKEARKREKNIIKMTSNKKNTTR